MPRMTKKPETKGIIQRKKNRKMGVSESGRACKNHPDHSQLSGVCPICLRERLAELQAFYQIKSSFKGTSLNFSSPFYSSGSSSPADHHRGHRRNMSEFKGSSISMVDLFGSSLRKSSSISFNGGEEGIGDQRKKKGGFWWKLIQFKGLKKKEAFLHSTNLGKIAV